MLSLTGSGMTALAGCIGGSSSSSPETTSTPTLTSGPSESDVIKDITYNSNPGSPKKIRAQLTLAEETVVNKINVISDGELFHSTRLATGETNAQIPIAASSAYGGFNSISNNNTEIILISDDSETKVPLTYEPEVQFKRLVPADEHDDLRSRKGDLGLLLDNPTNKPALVQHYRKDQRAVGGEVSDRFEFVEQVVIPKNSEFLAKFKRLRSVPLCGDISGETREVTVSFSMLFADDFAVTVPIELKQENKRDGCQTSVAGEAEIVPPLPEAKTSQG